LVAIGSEKEIRIWNTKNWSPTCYFGGLSFRTTALGFIEDRHLVVLSECDTPKIYTVATSQLNQTSPNVGYIKAVSFTNDGKRVLCLTPYGVSCWDNTSGRLKFQLPKVDEPTLFFAKEMVVSKCQRYLLTRQENEAVLWDLETKETIRSILRDEIKGVGFLSSGRVAIIGSNSLETYDIEKEKFFYCLANRVSSLSVYSFSEDGRWLAFANTDGTVIAYNCEGGQTYTLRNLHAASPVKSIKICNDTIISQSKICHIWRPLENWMRSYNHFDEAWTTKSAPNLILFRIGQTLGSYTENENTVSLRHRMEPMLSFLDISPTDTVLRADFGQVRLWSEETGRFQAGFKDAFHYSCLAMHPSLPIAAVGGQEGMIRIWNFETGKCLSFLKGHRTGVTHLLFSGDGSNLLSAADDNTMQSWDLKDIDRAYLQWRTPPYSLFLDSLNTHDVQCDISVENLLFDENAKTDKMLAMEWLLKGKKIISIDLMSFHPTKPTIIATSTHKEYNLEQSIIIINDKILAKTMTRILSTPLFLISPC
jgi:WD40 repeat protein